MTTAEPTNKSFFLGIANNKPNQKLSTNATYKSKTQFKMLLDCFRAWQDYVKLHQRQKVLKKRLLNGLIKAINKHEEFLFLKTFEAFRMARRMRIINQEKTIHLRAVVDRNLMHTMLMRMRRVAREFKLEGAISVVAKQHFKSRMRKKCFKSWRSRARRTKEAIVKMSHLMKKKPISMDILMKFIGFQIMPKDQLKKFDLLDFHSFCTLKNRYKPNQARLSQNLGLALKSRLKQIVKSWKGSTDKIVTFKTKVRLSTKRRVFQALDKQCALSFRLKIFRTKKDDKQKEQVIVSLLKNLEKVKRLQNATNITKNIHKLFVYKRFLTQWQEIHKFYQANNLNASVTKLDLGGQTQITFDQKSLPLKVLHLQKKRVFVRFQRYQKQQSHKRACIRS